MGIYKLSKQIWRRVLIWGELNLFLIISVEMGFFKSYPKYLGDSSMRESTFLHFLDRYRTHNNRGYLKQPLCEEIKLVFSFWFMCCTSPSARTFWSRVSYWTPSIIGERPSESSFSTQLGVNDNHSCTFFGCQHQSCPSLYNTCILQFIEFTTYYIYNVHMP